MAAPANAHRPVVSASPHRGGMVAVAAGALFVALAALLGLGLWSTVTLGGIVEGVALLGGRGLYLRQAIIEVGSVTAGEVLYVEFSVQNLTSKPLTVLGARTDCSCAVVSGLPMTLAPRSRGTMQVELTPSPRDLGMEFERRIELYSDYSGESVWLTIRGHVMAAGRATTSSVK